MPVLELASNIVIVKIYLNFFTPILQLNFLFNTQQSPYCVYVCNTFIVVPVRYLRKENNENVSPFYFTELYIRIIVTY